MLAHIRQRRQNAAPAIPRGVAVPQLQRLKRPRARPRRHKRPPNRPVRQRHIHLNRGVAPRIKNLQRPHIRYYAHRILALPNYARYRPPPRPPCNHILTAQPRFSPLPRLSYHYAHPAACPARQLPLLLLLRYQLKREWTHHQEQRVIRRQKRQPARQPGFPLQRRA